LTYTRPLSRFNIGDDSCSVGSRIRQSNSFFGFAALLFHFDSWTHLKNLHKWKCQTWSYMMETVRAWGQSPVSLPQDSPSSLYSKRVPPFPYPKQSSVVNTKPTFGNPAKTKTPNIFSSFGCSEFVVSTARDWVISNVILGCHCDDWHNCWRQHATLDADSKSDLWKEKRNLFKRIFFCTLRNTRSKLMRIYNISLEVMTKFKNFIFRYVSQSEN
jgi:hypothetical protein